MYEPHESYAYRIDGNVRGFHWVPVADWQYWFVTEKMSALTEELGIVRKNNGDTIKDFCHQKTLECYDKITAK
jgi:hypothetical protein